MVQLYIPFKWFHFFVLVTSKPNFNLLLSYDLTIYLKLLLDLSKWQNLFSKRKTELLSSYFDMPSKCFFSLLKRTAHWSDYRVAIYISKQAGYFGRVHETHESMIDATWNNVDKNRTVFSYLICIWVTKKVVCVWNYILKYSNLLVGLKNQETIL